MRIIKAKDYDDLSRKAANIISAQVLLKPDCVLGLATGSTPIGTYKQLIEWYEKGDLDFSAAKSVNLDEYRGLTRDTNVPDGTEPDSEKECSRYENVIEAYGGVDLQLLGLGHNGHIGFNEPDKDFPRTTHCVDLTQSTIEANKRFFASVDDVPKQAYTMGIGTIMKARKILLVVSGADKAQILHDVLCGPVTPEVPASILQLHSDVIVVADEAAMAKL